MVLLYRAVESNLGSPNQVTTMNQCSWRHWRRVAGKAGPHLPFILSLRPSAAVPLDLETRAALGLLQAAGLGPS